MGGRAISTPHVGRRARREMPRCAYVSTYARTPPSRRSHDLREDCGSDFPHELREPVLLTMGAMSFMRAA